MTAIPTSTALIERLRAMFAAGIEVAKDYGDNAHHLEGAQLERQFQIRLTRMICAEPTATEPQEATAERPAEASYPYGPPADAKEWTCPKCGKDVLWCGCFTPASPRSAAQEAPRYLKVAEDATRLISATCWPDGYELDEETRQAIIGMVCNSVASSAPPVGVAALRAQWQECIDALIAEVEEFTGWWSLNREGSVNRTYDHIDKTVKRMRSACEAYDHLCATPPLTAKERRWCSTCGTDTCWCIEL